MCFNFYARHPYIEPLATNNDRPCNILRITLVGCDQSNSGFYKLSGFNLRWFLHLPYVYTVAFSLPVSRRRTGTRPSRPKGRRLWCLCVRTTVGSNPSQEKSDHRKKDDLINRGGSDDADPRWVRSRFGHVEAVEIAAVGGLVGSQAVSVRTYQDPQGIMDTP